MHLADGVLHLVGADELAFFDVDGFAGAGAGGQKVRLAAQKRGYLQAIDDFANRTCLVGFVDIGQDGQGCFGADFVEQGEAFGHAGTAETVDAGAVGLVETGLEDALNLCILLKLRKERGDLAADALVLNDAGACDDKELAFEADLYPANLECFIHEYP